MAAACLALMGLCASSSTANRLAAEEAAARGEVRVPEDCKKLKQAVKRVHGDDVG